MYINPSLQKHDESQGISSHKIWFTQQFQIQMVLPTKVWKYMYSI